jgi:hypothetical protein
MKNKEIDLLFLKWGKLKRWSGVESQKGLCALNKHLEGNPDDKESILEVINSLSNPIFILDFYDKKITKEQALEYITYYPNDKTSLLFC